MKTTKGERIAYDLMQLVDAHAAWSDKTFGTPAKRGPEGPLKHLAKEALEALASPNDPLEYADCLLLILDASRRAGFDLETLLHATLAKLAVNKGRKWPKAASDEPVEHSKEQLIPLHLQHDNKVYRAAEVRPDQCEYMIVNQTMSRTECCLRSAGHSGPHESQSYVYQHGDQMVYAKHGKEVPPVGEVQHPGPHDNYVVFEVIPSQRPDREPSPLLPLIERMRAIEKWCERQYGIGELDEKIIQQAETDGLKPLPEPEPKLVITVPPTGNCGYCGREFLEENLTRMLNNQGAVIHVCKACIELMADSGDAVKEARKCGGCGKPALPGRYICQECEDAIPF